MCGDNLKLEPFSGELEPGTHQNIKMTLVPARFPTHFDGEIQCSIDWESAGDEQVDMKSMHTTHINEAQEYLFLRIKKRTKITRETRPVEARENDTMFQNVLGEMVNDILADSEIDELLDGCHDSSGGIFNQVVTSNEEPPSTEKLYNDIQVPDESNLNALVEQKVYKENLKELTGNDEDDLVRKTAFLDKKFQDMLEYMMEDTLFNLMEEATYEEFDLTKAPKIYIRKDQTY